MTTKLYRTGKRWSIGTKKYAISDPAATVALAYGENVSKGILKMEECLEDYREYLQGRIGKDAYFHTQEKNGKLKKKVKKP
jgi:hypothetical protein